MKYLIFALSLIFAFACQPAPNDSSSDAAPQSNNKMPSVDTSIFETFSYQEGDTTYLMKKYFMVHLKAGPNREQDEAETQRIQTAHLAHLEQLGKDQKICIAGPFEGGGELRGLAIMSVPDLATADSLANADPAVKAGRLSVEVIPFWAAVGSQLF